jgi:glyoxylase-like metal-dependent hydrolase (beta-lactamase superfamily II)
VRTEEPDLRCVLADNPGPFTLDGTRTYVVGTRQPVVVDPGPDVEAHLRAVGSLVEDAERVTILLTHGHGDHAGGAARLARSTGGRILGAGPVEEVLSDGDSVETDAGELVAVSTPGHARDHLCFHWRQRGALFAGDLVLGEGDTTWVAGYPGCVADYLRSLARLRGMALRRIYPAHGDPIDDVDARLARFEEHRRERIAQVEAALEVNPSATRRQILERVYGGTIPPALESAAMESLGALLDYLGEGGRP